MLLSSLYFAGSLFERIKTRGHLTEMEASKIIRDLADALDFLHHKGNCSSICCVCLREDVRMLAMAGDCHCYGTVCAHQNHSKNRNYLMPKSSRAAQFGISHFAVFYNIKGLCLPIPFLSNH